MKYQVEVCSSVTEYWPWSSVEVTVTHTHTHTHIYFKSTLSVLFPQQLLLMNGNHVNNDLYNTGIGNFKHTCL